MKLLSRRIALLAPFASGCPTSKAFGKDGAMPGGKIPDKSR